MPECLWRSTRFERRRGGKLQKFCREDCRREFARVALAYVEEAMAARLLSLDRLREGVQSNAALPPRGDSPPPGIPAAPEPPTSPGAPQAVVPP
jgi:hypothetical protein